MVNHKIIGTVTDKLNPIEIIELNRRFIAKNFREAFKNTTIRKTGQLLRIMSTRNGLIKHLGKWTGDWDTTITWARSRAWVTLNTKHLPKKIEFMDQTKTAKKKVPLSDKGKNILIKSFEAYCKNPTN